MKLLIKQLLKKSLLENNYKGSHTAPDKESGEPLYDLINTYGEDIYGLNAVRYYGGGSDSTIMDNFSISIIKSVRNKPNAQVKIYRAVPDFNYETNKRLKELDKLLMYYNKFKFFPINNKTINDIEVNYSIEKYSYDNKKKLVLYYSNLNISRIIYLSYKIKYLVKGS